MSLRKLTTAEMVSLTASWVESGHADRRALESVPALAGFLPEIERAQSAVLATQSDAVDARLVAIREAQKELDRRHDALARAIWHAVNAQIHHAEVSAPAEVAVWQNLRDTLFPDRLRVVQYSYRQEAGHARLLASRLTAADRSRLERIPLGSDSLLGVIQRWVDVAAELGEFENQRTDRRGNQTRASIARARGVWTQVVRTLRMMIETVGVEDPVILDMMARIDAAMRVASRRGDGGSGVAEGEEPGLDGDGEPGPDDGDDPVSAEAEPGEVGDGDGDGEPEPDGERSLVAEAEPDPALDRAS